MEINRCNKIRERFPFLLSGTLNEKEREQIIKHLGDCKKCRELFESEMALYITASIKGINSPFADHLDSETLSDYAYNRHRISVSEIEKIKLHLAECKLCSDAVARLHQLPLGLKDLLAGSSTPVIDSLENQACAQADSKKIARLIWDAIWRPAVAYGIAAVILLVALFRPANVQFISPAVVVGNLSSTIRGDQETEIFISPTPQCYFQLNYYVDPESGHQYDIQVVREDSDRPLYFHRDYRNFNRQGYLTLPLLLDTGKYELLINDIEGIDTVTTPRLFEIQLTK